MEGSGTPIGGRDARPLYFLIGKWFHSAKYVSFDTPIEKWRGSRGYLFFRPVPILTESCFFDRDHVFRNRMDPTHCRLVSEPCPCIARISRKWLGIGCRYPIFRAFFDKTRLSMSIMTVSEGTTLSRAILSISSRLVSQVLGNSRQFCSVAATSDRCD